MPGYGNMRLPASYRELRSASPQDFAWEWLRRNPEFRAIWKAATAAAHRASAISADAIDRSRRPQVVIPRHSLERRWSLWGVSFRTGSRHTGA